MTQRMESAIKRNDLIDILIELKKNYGQQDMGEFKFDDDDIVAQAVIFFTGGYETSSTAMAFALYELAIQPEIQDKLRKEIHNALNESDNKITYNMVSENAIHVLLLAIKELL
ncbi:probable cytochrome P450 6g2 [Formica exsecta]|uniref:probable cytochrome P450 6g2 n=1 Tax=Formica exsecta TaxID=72781 RepID=UPI001143CEE1|nr:probable cytochrome P450 6g2 [Formica exsecta]